MSALTDFQIELLRYAPGTASPPEAPIDITDQTLLDGFGAVNRAAERDLLSFKTGDLTLTFRDADGVLEDLFAHFMPVDRWQLRVWRRGVIQFRGAVLGAGSVIFRRTDKTVEITAYGLTRQLKDTTAETVKRTLTTAALGATLTAGATTATLDTTAGLLTGDILHVTDHVNKEDLTVKQVTSGTIVSLEAAAVNTYASGSTVTPTTPYHRYKTIEFLVRELFDAALIPLADFRLDDSQFRRAAPTPVNLEGLSLTAWIWGGFAERNGRAYGTLVTGPQAGPGTYYQADPDSAWTQEDATVRAWVDWSRYYTQEETPPSIILRTPNNLIDAPVGGGGQDPHIAAWDYKPSTKTVWWLRAAQNPGDIASRTTVDGTTWAAAVAISNLPTDAANVAYTELRGCEFDQGRNALYVYWRDSATDEGHFYYLDLSGPTWTSLKQADDAGKGYYGAVYVADKDYTLALRGDARLGPAFEISAWRGQTRLWVRPFPSVKIVSQGTGEALIYPTHSLRYLNGSFYCLGVSDGALQLIRSDDEFQTYVMREIAPATSNVRAFGSRVLGSYRIFGYSGATPRTYLIAAPFYAGIVSYADFEGKSASEALADLSILVNAIFWVDDAGEGHFVARDLFDPGAVLDITDRIKARADTAIWDQIVQYIEVGEQVSGDNNFSASGLSLDSDFAPNEAFEQALADSYADFYSRKRAEIELTMIDPDGHIYRPLDRALLDGIRYMVYESDHDLVNDEVSLTLLEDA